MSTMSIYELTFAQSDKTDAVLVVEDKKLHVDKALLSYHSDYFNTLFNGEFKEKSMPEIPIKDVKFEDFATLLSLVQDKPIEIKKDEEKLETLLELADRFLMPAVKRHVELYIIARSDLDKKELLALADKHDLKVLRKHSLGLFKMRNDYRDMYQKSARFSDKTKLVIFDYFFYNFDKLR